MSNEIDADDTVGETREVKRQRVFVENLKTTIERASEEILTQEEINMFLAEVCLKSIQKVAPGTFPNISCPSYHIIKAKSLPQEIIIIIDQMMASKYNGATRTEIISKDNYDILIYKMTEYFMCRPTYFNLRDY
jgi:hypothetical protein